MNVLLPQEILCPRFKSECGGKSLILITIEAILKRCPVILDKNAEVNKIRSSEVLVSHAMFLWFYFFTL